MIRLSKQLVKNLPRLRQVFFERDRLRLEREQLMLQCDRALAEIGRLRSEKDQAVAQASLSQADKQRADAENQALRAERDRAVAEKNEYVKGQWVLPGHYYSALPAIDELRVHEKRIWGQLPRQLPAVDLNENEQLALFSVFKNFYADMPEWPAERTPELRYYHVNGYYPYGDATMLYCMIRYLRPKRIIEVGSGYSSCVTLDTNERFFDNSIQSTFIEPYPQRLQSLLRPADMERIDLRQTALQDVDLDLFRELGPRDVLFIDSTHVTKCDSDVNYILFHILPALQHGVFIHIHDVFYPFEYPQVWVYEGKAWNEDYILRAFLQYNNAFKIQFWFSYLKYFHKDRFPAERPLMLKHAGSGIWLRKV